MTSTVEPNIEVYGKYARVSALADYAELLSVKGFQVSQERVSDYAQDLSWTGEELIRCPDEPPSPDSVGDQVFRMLEERAYLAQGDYPFTLDSGVLRASHEAHQTVYLAFLALLTAHAYDFEITIPPHQTFELGVAEAMFQRGLRVSPFGAVRRRCRAFDIALHESCLEIGLTAAPDAAAVRSYAHDEGVDILCHLDWRDDRPGAWGMIGQVTCARSEQWHRKLSEPWPGLWAGLLNTIIQPLPFLSLPHHVDRCMMRYLTQGGGLVIDRMRLCTVRSTLLHGEIECIDAVLGRDYEPFA